MLKLTVAYDGTAYVGWQRQAEGVSIQGLIETAVARIEEQPATVTGAGRTDAGVHALAQVASVSVASAIPCDAYQRALNASLPADVRVLAVEEASSDFHARFSARGKSYRYRLWLGPVASPFEARFAWHVTHALDRDAMREALAACVGRYDFAALQATGTDVKDTIRTITAARLTETSADAKASASHGPPRDASASPRAPGDPADRAGSSLVAIDITGDGFLRHMVRTLVGTLVEIGRGRWAAGDMAAILDSRDRGRAGPTAPPQGLFLVEVEY
jgi:tRNA pseudouridine38-40 synthase